MIKRKILVKDFLEKRSSATYGKKLIFLRNGKNCGSSLENLNSEVISVKVTSKWVFITIK